MPVTIAVIDSGIQSSGDFSGRIAGFYDFTNSKGGVPATPITAAMTCPKPRPATKPAGAPPPIG